MTEQIIIQLANQQKIPILHLQEGLHHDTQEAYEHSKFQTVFLESASKYIAWGKLSKDFQIKGMPTSIATKEQAKKIGIELVDINEYDHIDIAIDGADEVLPDKF